MSRLLGAAAGQMQDPAPKVKCRSEASFPMNRVALKVSTSSPYL
jgi:hypothetical protein